MRKAGNRIRINAHLIDAGTGGHLWAERYDGDLEDVFELQDTISARIVSALEVHLTPADREGTARKPTNSIEAYDLCLKGRAEYYRYTPKNFSNAKKYFEQAIEIDPNYGEAHGYLSYCHTATYVFSWPGADETLDRALALAETSIALDDKSPVAHTRLGWVLGYLGRFDEAIENFERAIALDPRNAEAYQSFGETMNRGSDPERALRLLEKAFSLDIIFPPSWEFALGHSFILLRRYEDARSKILPVLDRVPKFLPARVQLARAYSEMNRTKDAQAQIAAVRDISPRYTIENAKRMFPYPKEEDRRRLLDGLRTAGLPETL